MKNTCREQFKSLYNFKNYLKYKLGCYNDKDTEMNNFIELNNKLQKFLSLENSVLETEFKIQAKNENPISNFFRSIDFNAKGAMFMILEKNEIRSIWGSIFTGNIILGSIIIFYYFGEDCWKRINPSLSFTQYDLKNFTSNDDLFNVPIMISINKSLADVTKLVYLNHTNNLKYQDLNAEICKDEDFNFFNVSNLDPDMKYFCSNYNKIFKNVTNLSQRLDSYIYVANCTELADYNIDDSECKGKTPPKYGSQINYKVWLATKEFYNSYDNFIVDKIDIIYNQLLYSNVIYNQFFSEHILKFKKLNDDKDLIFNSIKEYFFSSTMSIRQRNNELDPSAQIPYSPKGKRLYVHTILIDPTYSSIDRIYQKIDKMFARVMSMTSILILFCLLINNYISDYLLFSNLKNEFIKVLNDEDYKKFAKIIEMQEVQREFLIYQINFKNYLLNSLFFKNRNTTLFNELYKRFKMELSCHNLYKIKNVVQTQTLKTKSNVVKYVNKENLEENLSFLQKADIFSEANYFYYENQMKFKTIQGGIISFFHIFIILFCLFFFGYDFWTSRISEIQINQRSYYELSEDEKLNHIDCPFSIAYSKSVQEKLKVNLKHYYDFGLPPGALNECSDEEYQTLFNSEKNNTLYYLCGNLNYTLGNPLYDYTWYLDYLLVGTCSDMKSLDKSIVNCNSNPRVDENFRIEFKFKLRDMDLNNYKSRDKILTLYSDGNYNNMIKSKLNFRYYKVTNFINNIVYRPEDFMISTVQYYSTSFGRTSEFYFVYHIGQIWIKLIYVNFPEMLAKVFSMMKLLTYIIKWFHLFFFEYKFKKSVLKNILKYKDFQYIKNMLMNSINFRNSNINNILQSDSEPNNFSEIKNQLIQQVSKNIYTFKNYILMKIFNIKNQEIAILDQKINSILSIERLFDRKCEMKEKNYDSPLKLNPEKVQILKKE
jgi:hypothetical protein